MSANLKHLCRMAIALCLLFGVSQSILAQVYTYVDADGNRVFTDQPHRNAKKVDIAPTNRVAQPTSAPARP